MLKVINKI